VIRPCCHDSEWEVSGGETPSCLVDSNRWTPRQTQEARPQEGERDGTETQDRAMPDVNCPPFLIGTPVTTRIFILSFPYFRTAQTKAWANGLQVFTNFSASWVVLPWSYGLRELSVGVLRGCVLRPGTGQGGWPLLTFYSILAVTQHIQTGSILLTLSWFISVLEMRITLREELCGFFFFFKWLINRWVRKLLGC
jgi:hypothetical protein